MGTLPKDLTHTLLNSLPHQLAVLDSDGTIVYINETWRRFDLEVGFFAGKRLDIGDNYLLPFKHAEDDEAASVAAAIEDVLQGVKPSSTSFHRFASGREEHWFEIDARSVGAQAPYAAVISHTDITRLYRDKATLAAIRNATTSAIISMDATSTITLANQAAEQIFGYEPRELHGQHVTVLMPGYIAQQHDGYVSRYTGGGSPKVIGIGREVTAMRKDGSTFPVHLSVGEWSSEGERYFVGIIQDLTKQEEFENELRRARTAQAALGRAADKIAHDLNNLLAPMLGLTRMSIGALPPDHKIRSGLEQVVKATERCKGLAEQILSLSQQQPTGQHLAVLCEVIEEASNMIRSMAPASVAVNTELQARGYRVLADPDEMYRVVLNLGANALRAIGTAPGRINILLEEETLDAPRVVGGIELPAKRYLKLSVADNGTGIEKDALPRIFDPHFTSTANGSGTGLGLAIVRGIVMSHRGAIAVQSVPGEGTTFVIYLPIHDRQDA